MVSYFSEPVFLKSNIFNNFKIHYVASGTLLIEYFALRNDSRNDCSLVAICFCDFFFFLKRIKGWRTDAYSFTFPTHLLRTLCKTRAGDSHKTSVPTAHEEYGFCPCVCKLGNSICKWVFRHVITQFGGANAHLLVLISLGQFWCASW